MRHLIVEAANLTGTDFIVVDTLNNNEILKNDELEYCQEFIDYYNTYGILLGSDPCGDGCNRGCEHDQ